MAWRLEWLEKLQAVDKQLSNDTLAVGMDCFKNKKPELAERAFGKVLKLTSRRFNPKANFEAKVPHPTPLDRLYHPVIWPDSGPV